MSIAVKIRRGTTTEHSTFTGLEGEITVDTTKKTVVVHDGATVGGIPLATEAAVNDCFQSVSDGKTLVAAAITDKGVPTAATDSFPTMATNIGSIATGGGATTGDYRVRFIDYDGTILQTSYANSGGSVTAPSNPDHTADGLTFQEWNYTSAALSNITSDLDVGATYITTDGKTHLYITLTAVSGLAPTLYLNKSDASTLSVDWGDGNASTFANSGNFNTGAHTYSAAGDYVIKLWISSGSGTYQLGSGSSSTVVVGGSAAVYRQTLVKAFIGNNVTSIGGYAFVSCYSLTNITIPNNVTSTGMYTFANCYSLVYATVPTGVTIISGNVFNNCYALITVSLPYGITSIDANAFGNCYALGSIVLPGSVTNIGGSAFSSCYALARVKLSTGISTINPYAFNACYALESIIISTNITSIGTYAFAYCYACKSYTIQRAAPPTLGANAFNQPLSICRIKVPSASLAAYQAATGWSTYANRMEGY